MGWLGLGDMKSKLALLALMAVLAVVGFALAGVAVALGAGNTLQKKYTAKIVDVGDSYHIEVYDRNGEMMKEAVIPKPKLGEAEITIVMNDEGKVVSSTSEPDEGASKPVVNEKVVKAIEIANKDGKVLELTENKGIGLDQGNPVAGALIKGEHVTLKVLIKGKVYDIVVDLANEVVESIEESKTGNVIEISLTTEG